MLGPSNRGTPRPMKLTRIATRTPLVSLIAFGVLCLAGHSALAQAPAATPSDVATELAALKKEIEILKGKVPDQSHAMKDVAYHFTNLWFAGQNQNWPLAKFYCDETRSHLKWA